MKVKDVPMDCPVCGGPIQDTPWGAYVCERDPSHYSVYPDDAGDDVIESEIAISWLIGDEDA